MIVAGLIRVMALYLVRKLKNLYNVTISRILLQKKTVQCSTVASKYREKKYDTTAEAPAFLLDISFTALNDSSLFLRASV